MFQKKITSSLLFLLLIACSQRSNAAFVITPNVGYKSQTIKLTDNANVDVNMKMSDPSYGLKLGFQSLSGVGFDVAGDITSGKSHVTSLSVEKGLNYSHTTAAAQLSVRAQIFKIYLGYVFLNEMTIKGEQISDNFKTKGTGYQAGIALALSRSIELTAQYQIDLFNQINFESVQSYEDIKNYYKKVDIQSLSLYLSYAF